MATKPKVEPRIPVEAVAELREKNQLTLPRSIADALGAEPGDRLIFRIDPDRPDVVRVYRLWKSYAGMFGDVFGGPEEVRDYLEGERRAWEE